MLGRYKAGSYVRRCLVRPMYLSASVMAVSTWGAITSARPLGLQTEPTFNGIKQSPNDVACVCNGGVTSTCPWRMQASVTGVWYRCGPTKPSPPTAL